MSNVTGHNLDLLKNFLNLLTIRMPVTDDQPAEFQIDETYSVPVSAILCNYIAVWCTLESIGVETGGQGGL